MVWESNRPAGLRGQWRGRSAQGGYALVTVLLVLMSLLILCTPFLWTASSADRTSARLASDAQTRVALDTAARHARYQLSQSHPAFDTTRFYDSSAELNPTGSEMAHLLSDADGAGAMWGHTVEDLSGRVDLSSAPPQLLANLLGQGGFLTRPLGMGDNELEFRGAEDLRPSGLLWVDGELIQYSSGGDGRLEGLVRGLLGVPDGCGPRVASGHGAGLPIMGFDAWGLASWRLSREMRDPRGLSVGDVVREMAAFIPAALVEVDSVGGELSTQEVLESRVLADITAALEATTTLHGGVAAGDRWMYPVRIQNDLTGGVDCAPILTDARWINPGTTVMLRQGETTELALVRSTGGNRATLTEVVRNSYTGGEAELYVLARRPVNVNSASPRVLRALFENLKLRGVNQRITRSEAEELAVRVVLARPFQGFEDFLVRVVLPAAGVASIDQVQPLMDAQSQEAQEVALERLASSLERAAEEYGPPVIQLEDATALLRNAVCASDSTLEYSTVPLSFTSRDTYAFELRAAVNAPTGVQRLSANRRQLEWVVPPGDLLRLWTMQEDFDEALRLGRGAPGWGTGPEKTTIHDRAFGTTPPPRSRSYFQLTQIEPQDAEAILFARGTFPSRNEGGFAQPWHVRLDEVGPRAGNVEHFDYNNLPGSNLEGYETSEEPWIRTAASLGLIDGGLLAPFEFSFWAKPLLTVERTLMDLAGDSPDGDRVTLFIDEESGDLVLRAIDGPGDHPDTEFEEFSEVRLELGESGALPADTWSHLEVSVRGTRPDQMALRVDGFNRARTPGLTRLTGSLSSGDTTIRVESTEGFPDRGPIRIGNEVIEAVVVDDETLRAEFTGSGELAGFGGRLAREITAPQDDGTYLSAGLLKDTSYETGTPVQVYGYSAPIDSNVPAGGLTLRNDLGAFTTGRVIAVEGPSNELGDLLSTEIDVTFANGSPGVAQFQFGRGWDSAEGEVTALRIEPVDGGATTEDVMSCFNADGGYAAVMQRNWTAEFDNDNIDDPDLLELATGTPVGGLEIVRYSSVSDDLLEIPPGGFGIDASELARLGDGPADFLGDLGGPRAYILDWELALAFGGGGAAGFDEVSDEWNDSIEWQVLIVPISIGVNGSTQSLLEPQAGRSEFVQITEVGADRGLTEWVRYDEAVGGFGGLELVRSDPDALLELFVASINQNEIIEERLDGALPGGGGGPFDPAAFEPTAALLPEPVAPTAPTASPAPQIDSGSFWAPEQGGGDAEEVVSGLIHTRAARSAFQFRGVLGTWSHDHSAGVDVLPVFRIFDRRRIPGEVQAFQHVQPQWGWPGADDAVFLMDEDVEDIGSPGVVHRAVRPDGYIKHNWAAVPGLGVEADPLEIRGDQGFVNGAIHVAMREPLGVFGAPSAGFNEGAGEAVGQDFTDVRTVSRLVKFPSGELPRRATQLVLGGDVAQLEDPVAMVVDEVFRRSSQVHNIAGQNQAAAFVLAAPLSEDDESLLVAADRLRSPRGDLPLSNFFSSAIDNDAGLLRVGDEILAYIDVVDEGGLVLPSGGAGRGLLGTEAQPHALGEPVHFLNHISVTNLSVALEPEDWLLRVDDNTSFDREGTVLVGNELIHHTLKRGGLAMPARSENPGEQDFRGDGIYRGRYGTEPGAYSAGTPVIHFQTRYWDRFAERADAPEQHFFGIDLPQPDAWVRALYVETTDAAFGGARVGVLVRTDPTVPWDADPDEVEGLDLHWLDRLAGRPVPVGAQASRVEWRVFTEFTDGAFDAINGPHGWKGVPTIDQLAVDYIAPGRVFERSDR